MFIKNLLLTDLSVVLEPRVWGFVLYFVFVVSMTLTFMLLAFDGILLGSVSGFQINLFNLRGILSFVLLVFCWD